MNKNKESLRKEILSLINDIKEHADGLNPSLHFPQLELEAISSKIKKLYERSIILSFINSMSDIEIVDDEINIKGIGDVEVPMLDVPVVTQKNVEQKETTTTMVEKQLYEAPKVEKVVVAEVEMTQSIPATNYLTDITKFFSISIKMQILNQLFKGRNEEYVTFVNELNACNTMEQSLLYVKECAAALSWNTEADVFKQLHKFIEKRFA